MQTGLIGADEAEPIAPESALARAHTSARGLTNGAVTVRLGFLTSVYAKQSHTFMRQEVARLRDMGWDVQTFSIRRSAESDMVDAEVRREHETTEYILDAGMARLVLATFREMIRSPSQFLAALGLMRRVSTPGVKGHLTPLVYLLEACYLARLLRARGVEHLHNHLGRNSAVVAMLTSTLTGIPYSLTIHGPTEFDEPGTLSLGLKIQKSAFTVAISDYGRSQLCRWTALADWPRIHVVHCGVSRSFRGEMLTPLPDAPRLVSVGRLAEQKGQLVLIEAAGLLRDRGVPFQLEIVGDGPMRGEIERRVAALGVCDHVHLAGWKDSAGVRQAILDSRLMVMPSFAEGLPVVLMESLALGRPVVSTYVAGIPELVRPGREGWLVPPGSAEMLAEALAEALSADTAELTAMGQSGAQRVAQRHDAAIEAGKLAGLIVQATQRPPTSSGDNSS
jgi:colanic acid/amylovoran biosynthesis glycosyltransferase